MKWPIQGRPSKKEWKIWGSMLKLHFCSSSTNLKTTLGEWLTVQKEQWWYSPSEDSLCFGPIDVEGLQRWVPKVRKCRGRNRVFVPSKSFLPPNDLQPAIVECQGASAWFSGSAPVTSLVQLPHEMSHYSKVWSSLPPDIQWPLENCKGWENIDNLRIAHNEGYLIASTDGSHKEGRGTASWRIRDARNASIILTGENISPGSSIYQDSTRAELSGCYGIACAFHFLHVLTPLPEKYMTMVCDSTSAFDKILSGPVKLKSPHCDIVTGFKAIVRNLPTQWKLHHVEGHQDKHTPFSKMDMWGQENDLCDKAAG